MARNVVSAVKQLAQKHKSSGNGTVQTPAQWATEAGFPGSAASPLRGFLARDSKNGVGRSGRYVALSPQGMLDAIADAERYAAEEAASKRQPIANRIGKRIKPQAGSKAKKAAKSGASAAKTTARGSAKAKTQQRKQERAAKSA